jgi:tetratricopeptide (TPR) repeat protein
VSFDRGTWITAATAAIAAAGLGVLVGIQAGATAGELAAAVTLALAALVLIAAHRLAGSTGRKEAERMRARQAPAPHLLADRSTPRTAGGGVARYLEPEAQVTAFWPRAELDELVDWAVALEHVAVALVTGGGGSGKTRLALQLAERITEHGYGSHWVPAGTEPGAIAAARDAGQPTLLVVDDAETRSGLPALLEEVANYDIEGPDIRVLLLALTAGEWWQQLISMSDYKTSELLAAARPFTLGPVAERARQPAVFRQALTAFAAGLGVSCPDTEIMLADPDAVILVVHAAALLAVVEPGKPPEAEPRSAADALTELLEHEAKYWQQSQQTRNLGLDPVVARQAVALACLVGADDKAAASKLLMALPALADSARRRRQVGLWLHELYPVLPPSDTGPEWIGALMPSLLAEHLVVRVLADEPDLIPALLTRLPGKRAARALTFLARAALTDPAAADQLGETLRSDPEHLVIPALTVAVTTNPVVGDLIKTTLESSVVSADVLKRIAAAIPFPSVALAETALIVIHRLAGDPENPTGQRAGWLATRESWLSALGRKEEALTAISEAVTIYRQLAPAAPDAYMPGLAESLNNQSNRLSDLGRREEALTAISEAVTIYRQLAPAAPDAYMPGLAESLNNQSNRLSDLGRREEALTAISEAVTIRRGLVAGRPSAFLPGFAESLNNQSIRLSDLGWREEALAAISEAVTIYGQLAQARPDTYLHGLATSLNHQSAFLSRLGRREPALAAVERAVTIGRGMAQSQPEAFLPSLAESLNNQSNRLSGLGRREDALTAINEAVTCYRRLVQARPGAFLPSLAISLDNQAARLSALARQEDALTAINEAIAINRAVAKARPEAVTTGLPNSLRSQCDILSGLRRVTDALSAITEAVALYRQMAAAQPEALMPDFAESLASLSAVLSGQGRDEEALTVIDEAVRILRALAKARPSLFLPKLAALLTSRADLLESLGRGPDANAARAEAAQMADQPDH